MVKNSIQFHTIILYFISKTIINQQNSTAKIHLKNAGHIGLFKLRFGEGIFVCLKSLSTSFNANSYSMMCTIKLLSTLMSFVIYIWFQNNIPVWTLRLFLRRYRYKGWNSKLFSYLNKKLSFFVTFRKILESFEKFIFYMIIKVDNCRVFFR